MTTADELLGRLAALDREGLAKVLAHRPDVLQEPWPRRLDVVAARLASAQSVNDAVLGLALPQVQVLHAVQLGHALGKRPTPVGEIARLLGTTAEVAESFVDELAERALLWRDPDGVRLPKLLHKRNFSAEGLGQPVAELLGEIGRSRAARLSRNLGLPDGRKELISFFRDGDRVRELFGTAPEPTRKLLRDMADGIPEAEGMLPFPVAEGWAFDHGFLFGTYYGSAVMPIEVSLALRGPDHQLP